MKRILISSFLVASTFQTTAVADTLGSLKKDIKNPSSENRTSANRVSYNSSYLHDDEGGLVDFFIDGLFNFGFSAIYSAASHSFDRTSGASDNYDYFGFNDNFSPRQLGDAALPIFQLEALAHNPWGDTFDANYSLLAGYGPIAIKYKNHQYWETDPADSLSIEQKQFLIRFAFGNHLEIHQGLGSTRFSDLNGFEEEEFAYSSPVIMHLTEDYQIEFTPTWSESINEYDVSLNKTAQFYSLKLGYRQLQSSSVNITGLYLGVALHF